LPLPARDAVVRFLPPVDALRALPFVSEDTLAALQELFGYPSGGSRISRSRTRHDRPTRLPGTSARSTFPTIFCTTNRSTSRDWQAARRCTRSTSHAFKLWVRRRCLALRRCTRLPSARRESLTSRRCRAALSAHARPLGQPRIEGRVGSGERWGAAHAEHIEHRGDGRVTTGELRGAAHARPHVLRRSG